MSKASNIPDFDWEKRNISVTDSRTFQEKKYPCKYVVEASGGEWDLSWNAPKAIFPTLETAKQFILDRYNEMEKEYENLMPEEEYNSLVEKARDYGWKKTMGDIKPSEIDHMYYNDIPDDIRNKLDEYEAYDEDEMIGDYCSENGIKITERELSLLEAVYYGIGNDSEASSYSIYVIPFYGELPLPKGKGLPGLTRPMT